MLVQFQVHFLITYYITLHFDFYPPAEMEYKMRNKRVKQTSRSPPRSKNTTIPRFWPTTEKDWTCTRLLNAILIAQLSWGTNLLSSDWVPIKYPRKEICSNGAMWRACLCDRTRVGRLLNCARDETKGALITAIDAVKQQEIITNRPQPPPLAPPPGRPRKDSFSRGWYDHHYLS